MKLVMIKMKLKVKIPNKNFNKIFKNSMKTYY